VVNLLTYIILSNYLYKNKMKQSTIINDIIIIIIILNSIYL